MWKTCSAKPVVQNLSGRSNEKALTLGSAALHLHQTLRGPDQPRLSALRSVGAWRFANRTAADGGARHWAMAHRESLINTFSC